MLFDINLKINLFTLNYKDKENLIKKKLIILRKYHLINSKIYKKIIDFSFPKFQKNNSLYDYPFIPVRLFKLFDLKSIVHKNIYKVLKSSGTTNNLLSKIYLDKKNSKDQVFVLNQIFSNFIGNKRLPMIILDSEETVKNKNFFSARAAAIFGFSIFGLKPVYILNNDFSLNEKKFNDFLDTNNNKKFLIFGFTSIIWKNFIQSLIKSRKYFNLSNGILLHGGGWKKLVSEGVSNKKFKKTIFKYTQIRNVINYYGMIEQTGSIFFECQFGYFHASEYSDIIIRDKNFGICKNRVPGLIQLISIVPSSYPGNSILSEDIGEIIGEDNCKCKRKGKYFLVHGRVKNAELRGCSDVSR